jgi:hypothetical protein
VPVTRAGGGQVKSTTSDLDPTRAGAAAILRDLLSQWGIGDLYADAMRLIKQGLDENAVLIQLQDTDAYKRRFAGNELRRKAGLAVLSPAEYVSVETSLKDVMRQYGLPAGFYDSPDDLTKFIGSDVSPQELSQRAAAAQKIWLSGNNDLKSQWRDYYGLSDGDGIASLLDPKVALPIIDQKLTAAQIGAAARRQGLDVDRTRAEYFQSHGVDEASALKGYSDIAASQAITEDIARRFGETFSQADAEDDTLLGLASAQRKRKDLYGKESALFSGRSGADQSALSKSTAGSY